MLDQQHPLVIKIGTAVLADQNGFIDEKVIEKIVFDVAELIKKGYSIAIVSSGAIGAGMGLIQQKKKSHKLKKKQALAAIGQIKLMHLYQENFAKFGIHVGQVLLSHEDFRHRASFLNTRATLNQLMELGVIPIVNENDTVSTEEIQFGDNDQLSVLIANAIEANDVIFLSTTEGLIDDSDSKKVIPFVSKIDKKIFSLAKGGNQMGRGGMGSKLIAINALNKAGKNAYLAHGKRENILSAIAEGQSVGTKFQARQVKTSSKQQWMLHHLKPHGFVEIDKGAFDAISKKHASLLSPGIKAIKGAWKAGNLLSIKYGQKEVARGMARLSSEQLNLIFGKTKEESIEILGEQYVKYVIHRNDIVLLYDV